MNPGVVRTARVQGSRDRCRSGQRSCVLALGWDTDYVPGKARSFQRSDHEGAGIHEALGATQTVLGGGGKRVVVVVPGLVEGERRQPSQVA